MKVTHDDATRLTIENAATGVWLIAGVLVLGTIGGVGLMSYLAGVVDPFQVTLAGVFLGILVPLLIGASPSVAISFEHGPREVRIRRSWPLYSNEAAIAYSAFDRVEAEKRYNKGVGISYALVMRLRNGRTVWLGQVTWADEQEVRALAARMNTALGVAPKARRPKGTGRVSR